MNIEVYLNDAIIRQAVAIFIRHYNDEDFIRRVQNVAMFNHTDHSSASVAANIVFFGNSAAIKIKSYRPKIPWSKAIAYADGDSIYFNERKSFTLLDRVETIMHEYCHLCGYQHDGNRVTAYNLQTVPYLVGNMFKDYVKEILESHP